MAVAPKKMVVIINTSLRTHGIGADHHHPNGEHSHGGMHVDGAFVLKPGPTDVDAERWAEAKEQKMVQLLITEGVLVEAKE